MINAENVDGDRSMRFQEERCKIILVDDRVGSKELADLIPDSVLTTLEYGDAAFSGFGPYGPNGIMAIGVERKVIGDLIQSISSGRLSGHQLPGLLEAYHKIYLIVEGMWKGNRKDGTIEVFRHGKFKSLGSSKFTSKRVWGYLTTLNATTGISVYITTDMVETALVIQELQHWWGQKWEKHKAHVMMNKLNPPSAYLRPGRPSLLRRIGIELPGVGYERIEAVEKAFKTVHQLFEATEEQWRNVDGIGKMTAKHCWEALHK